MIHSSTNNVFEFKTEVKQLLDLVINSLYSNKEIFLRELISNAADAIEKLRFEIIKGNIKILLNNYEPVIRIDFDKNKKTISVVDNGIGLSEDEIIEQLGTIAKSGTKKYLTNLSKEDLKTTNLIGQFGVGFYSAYLVANFVEVFSKKITIETNEGVYWHSRADGNFIVQKIEKNNFGTEVLLSLKNDSENLLDNWKLRQIITKYSNHITIPITMKKRDFNEKGVEQIKDEWEIINKATALWTLKKTEIIDFDYIEFYKQISYDFSEPLLWVHNKYEGDLEFISLLFIPKKAPFTLWDKEKKSGLNLYIKKIFILESTDLLPSYLRFVKGVVDSNDLPLNISREILQNNKIVEQIKKSNIKKILNMLHKLSEDDNEKYIIFWSAFGQILKEGPAEDSQNKEKIARLLRFCSTYSAKQEQILSLDEYINRMQKDQKFIYYITAESFQSAKNNPQLEIFNKNSIEVLLLYERIDEWMMSHLTEYRNKTLKSIAKGEIDSSIVNSESLENIEKQYEIILQKMKEQLNEKVENVKLSKRLIKSPSCIVVNDYGMSLHLQKIMAEVGRKDSQNTKPCLEINPNHVIVKNLLNIILSDNSEEFHDWVNILYNQAVLVEGGQLDNPSEFVQLINKYLVT